MDWFSVNWWTALFSIIVIDLLLAGDNAIVIGLAARNVPKVKQRKVIALGTVGAIAIRIAATLAVIWLLHVPGLLIAGGLLLVWIAFKLLVEEKKHDVAARNSLWAAVRTIIIADGIMGLDNVLGVAGAAHGEFELVIIGLLVSIPIVVWGSTLFLKLIDRFPAFLYIGAGVLAFTAAKMITGEPLLASLFDSVWIKWTVDAAVVAGVLTAGRYRQLQRRRAASAV